MIGACQGTRRDTLTDRGSPWGKIGLNRDWFPVNTAMAVVTPLFHLFRLFLGPFQKMSACVAFVSFCIRHAEYTPNSPDHLLSLKK